MKRVLLFLFAALLSTSAWSKSNLKAARIFGDNMVIQRHKPIAVWGWGEPGGSVKVGIRDREVTTVCTPQGKWLVYLPELSAGGPYELKIESADSTIHFKNILVGEVWLASGQSNMNFALGSVDDAQKVVEEANYAQIREFATPFSVSRTPVDDMNSGEWKICSSENAKNFSAVGYFFARKLHLDKKIPVGIIHSSVSGSIAQAWISSEALSSLPGFRDRVDRDILASNDDWQKIQDDGAAMDRERGDIIKNSKAGEKIGVHKAKYNDEKWKTAHYPVPMSSIGFGGYNMVWLRKTIDIPASMAGKELVLDLAKVIHGDKTYFNGQEVGSNTWLGYRSYPIPAKLVKAGKNTISIRLVSNWGYGRLGDEASDPKLRVKDGTESITLKGEWKYNGDIEPRLPVGRSCQNNITALYNTKIYPLIPFSMSGILWYQGEGNAGNPGEYAQLLPLLINDWRIRFEQGYLPFLVVQLPNLKEGGSWPRFREVQASFTTIPNVDMAVTIDVGDPYDIHPQNKRPVGERLCLAAEKMVFKDPIVSSGPLYKDMKITDSKVIVNFTSVGKGLKATGNDIEGFYIAGKDQKFYPAKATIEGESILLFSVNVKEPVAVRYAWDANPTCNLYNQEGLPAAPFRTDSW